MSIERFSLWRVDEYVEKKPNLSSDLIKIFNYLRSYLRVADDNVLHIPHRMSFFDGVGVLSEQVGLRASKVENRSLRIYLNFPIIARDRQKDCPVLILPYTLGLRLVFDPRAKTIKKCRVSKLTHLFDEMVQLFLVNKDLGKAKYDDLSRALGKLQPVSLLIMFSSILVLFILIISAVLFSFLSEFSVINRTILMALAVVLLILSSGLIKPFLWLGGGFYLSVLCAIEDLYRRSMLLPKNEQNSLVTHANDGLSFRLVRSLSFYFFKRLPIICSAIILLFIILAMTFVAYDVSILIMATTVVGYLIHRYLAGKTRDHDEQHWHYKEKLSSTLWQWVTSFLIVRGLKAYKALDKKLDADRRNIYQIEARRFADSFIYAVAITLCPITLFFLVALCVAMGVGKNLEPWQVSSLSVCALMGGLLIVYIINNIRILWSGPIDGPLIDEVGDWPIGHERSHVDPVNMRGAIELFNVSFSYPESGQLILSNFSLKLDAKQLCLISGASGSGKTTTIKMLVGLLKPNSGQIVFDGQDARGLNPRSLGQKFGVVFSESELFPGSVYQNVLCGRNLPTKDIEHLLLSHEIFDRLLDLPMGLQTFVYWHKKNLSHLERVLIVLARALVHKPQILFVDEIAGGLSSVERGSLFEYISKLDITRVITEKQPELWSHADQIVKLGPSEN